ncbi:PspC domain-containing protein [Hymenobacter sp. DG25A]|uniref:PspC domain-containing protein n=1 Tax=Hymenobacter sp. DG25A TaxID=1385663 RepID=UPI0006BDE8D5|nr:PspC domain-containing protein [Hymenobacter sp. DG25A]ALD20600.1 hypothetical protein AM218_04395 [Hymenobacter sp. DG25A]
MKKNISINLQGLIFHIEEDGYEVLGRYLAEVRAHFSGYPGHDEIVSDIEGRIAELFAARLSSTKQVITLGDVEEMTAKMGRVSEFQSADELDEDELHEAVVNGRMPAASNAAGTTAEEPHRLYRDMANRKIAGVAAGIARYFSINPLWVRLIFLALFFIRPLVMGVLDFNDNDFHVEGFNLGGFALITYIVLWIALPKRYDLTPTEEDPTFKKLYRDTDNGKIGGVSAGLAAYFKYDVVLFRLLFVLGIFVGFGIPLYIILWILLPEAKTASDRLRMRGDAVTLSGIDTNLRNQAFEAGATTGTNRPVGTFLEELFRNLRPLLNLIGSAIRIFVAVMLIILGFSLLIGTLVGLGAGLGILTSENIHLDGVPVYTMFGDLPWWFLLSAFLAAAIPALAMLLTGVGLLLRRTILRRSAALTLLGLWMLGIVGSVFGGIKISSNYQEDGEHTQEIKFPTLTKNPVKLDLHYVSQGHFAGSELVAADSGQAISVLQEVTAKGPTEAEANRTAASSVVYRMRAANDSTLIFDNHFRYAPGARLREQHLMLTLRLPRGRQYRMTREFADWLGSEFFVNSTIPSDVERYTFRMNGNLLECINCPASALENFDADEDNNNEGDFNVSVDSDDEDRNVNIEIGNLDFPTNLDAYEGGRRSFSNKDFSQIEVSGAYRVYVRRGDTYKIEAAGNERDLRNLRVETTGDRVSIFSRRGGLFGLSDMKDAILIRIQLPTLRHIELSGASLGDIAGFSGEPLQVEQSGASAAKLNVNVPRLELELSGACKTAVRGEARELKVDESGLCSVEALNLRTNRASLDLSGASKARVRVSERLQAEVTGSSNVYYAGNPNSVEKDESGDSHVRPLNKEQAE